MSCLFGGNDTPAPAPVPESPTTNEKAQEERQAASDAAISQSRAAGRQQTVFAGRDIAQDEQQTLGSTSKKRRAARAIVGE